MIRNLSYNDPKIKRELLNSVGESFSWMERLKRGGTGSPKLKLVEASSQIAELLNRDNNLNYCNAELRSKGIIIRFRSILETFGLIIPFYQLSIYKSDADMYSFFCGEHKVTVMAEHKRVHDFVQRVLEMKNKQTNTRIEDL